MKKVNIFSNDNNDFLQKIIVHNKKDTLLGFFNIYLKTQHEKN